MLGYKSDKITTDIYFTKSIYSYFFIYISKNSLLQKKVVAFLIITSVYWILLIYVKICTKLAYKFNVQGKNMLINARFHKRGQCSL